MSRSEPTNVPADRPNLARVVWDNFEQDVVILYPAGVVTGRSDRKKYRRPGGVRSWELHHKNRRVALSLNIWVGRPNSLILNGSWRGRVRLTKIERVFGTLSARNLGVGDWDFVRIEILTCSIDPYGCWELNPSKLFIFEPNKGQLFHKILARIVWDPRL